MNVIRFCLLLICLNFLVSCGQVEVKNSFKERLSNSIFIDTSNSKLAEVATPLTIKQLNQDLEKYEPQLKIIKPKEEQVFTQTDVSVELQVKDLQIFQDPKLKLGNHLDLILDNEVSKPIYDLSQPIVLRNLSPGTHSLRVFASRPWGESFKNDGAYAQINFSVLTETGDNRPNADIPLLTYGSPSGTYGAEPFLLDFYLTNAPLHAVAKTNSQLRDWRVKATVNGDSFLLEDWQPVYLSGFNQGENWIQLELIDEKGNNIENAFNNTVRVIKYDPLQTNTLSVLFTDEISLAEAQSIIQPKVILPEKLEIENIVDPVLNSDISQPTSQEPIKEVIKPQVKQNDTSKVTSENNLEMSGKSAAIANPKQTEVNQTEAEEQSPIPQQRDFPSTTETTPEKAANSSSETKIPDSTVSEKPEINQENLANEQFETSSVIPDKSEQVITIENKDAAIGEPIVETKISQSESDDLIKEANLEQVNKISLTMWGKKMLVGLRQKLEGLIQRLPTAV